MGVAATISKIDTFTKMRWLTLWLACLLFYCSSIYSTQAAVQKVPEITLSPDHVTEFDYRSHVSVMTGVNITLSAQVRAAIM